MAQKHAKGLGLLFGFRVRVVKGYNQHNNSVVLTPSDRIVLPKEIVTLSNTSAVSVEMAINPKLKVADHPRPFSVAAVHFVLFRY